jgi:DNA-binding IclR family transcriptional regulator
MLYVSHDILVPNTSVSLSPFARIRDRGHICNPAVSAVRALHVIELLTSTKMPMRAVEIAGPMALSPSSANQLLKTMVDAGYLIFDPISKRYYPSPRIAKLGGSLSDTYFGPGFLDGLMRAAHTELEQFVGLSVSQGSFMQIIDCLRTPDSPCYAEFSSVHAAVDAAIGLQIPMFGSCTGAAWLSVQSDETVRACLKLCRRELGEKANDVDAILARVRDVTTRGYAYGGVSANDNVRGLAVPLPPSPHGIVLVLGTIGLPAEMEQRREEIARQLKTLVERHFSEK